LIVKGGGASSVELFLLCLYFSTQDGPYVWSKHVAENKQRTTEFMSCVCVDCTASEQSNFKA